MSNRMEIHSPDNLGAMQSSTRIVNKKCCYKVVVKIFSCSFKVKIILRQFLGVLKSSLIDWILTFSTFLDLL